MYRKRDDKEEVCLQDLYGIKYILMVSDTIRENPHFCTHRNASALSRQQHTFWRTWSPSPLIPFAWRRAVNTALARTPMRSRQKLRRHVGPLPYLTEVSFIFTLARSTFSNAFIFCHTLHNLTSTNISGWHWELIKLAETLKIYAFENMSTFEFVISAINLILLHWLYKKKRKRRLHGQWAKAFCEVKRQGYQNYLLSQLLLGTEGESEQLTEMHTLYIHKADFWIAGCFEGHLTDSCLLTLHKRHKWKWLSFLCRQFGTIHHHFYKEFVLKWRTFLIVQKLMKVISKAAQS